MSSSLKASLVQWRELVRIVREGVRDTLRTLRWSSRVDGAFRAFEGRSLDCQLTKDYHRVEKGLALANPKRPFGSAVRSRLARGQAVLDHHSSLWEHVDTAVAALDQWNGEGVVSDLVAPPLVVPDEILKVQDHWFRTRHSVRDFDTAIPVTLEEVTAAIEIASQSTPSVCNRQGWKVYAAVEQSVVQAILSYQNGNSGFRESVPCVLVITVSRRWFAGAGERSQHLIDGGLFAMTLGWVFHASGLSSCMLNWSMSNSQSAGLRARIDAEEDEEIVMLMAVGHAANGARVARSPRRAVDDILSVVRS